MTRKEHFDELESGSVSTDEVQFGGDTVTKDETVGASYENYSDAGSYHNNNAGLVFSADKEIQLTEVTIDADFAGDLTIELRPFNAGSGTGSVVDSDTATVEQGQQRLGIDITVPDQNQEWWLGRADVGNTPLYRSDAGAEEFPFSAEPITVSSGGGFDGAVLDTYYYFFDIGVQWEGEHTAEMSQTGRAVDFEGSDIDTVESVSANHVGVGESVTYPDEWGSEGSFGIEEPQGDEYYANVDGMIIQPSEPVKIGDVTVDAGAAGTATLEVFPYIEGTGRAGSALSRYEFAVDGGQKTITLNQTLVPKPSYDGYIFSTDNSDIGLLMDNSYSSLPTTEGPITLSSGAGHVGEARDGYFFLFDINIQYDHPNGIYEPNTSISAEGAIGGTAEQFNNTSHITDTTTDDIGADLQTLVNGANIGDVIKIAPGRYSSKTTCVVDKTVHIESDGKSQHGGASTGPLIELENDDTPFIRVEDGRPSFTGLNLSCRRSGATTNGILFHSRAVVDNCTAEEFSAIPFYFHDAAERNYNLNGTKTNNVCGHSIDADLIKLTNSGSDPMDLNACTIDVGTYTGDSSGYAINADTGFGNTFSVGHVEGGGPIKGALRFNHNDNRGYVGYVENADSIVTFTDAANRNYVEVNYTYNITNDPVAWNEGGGSNWGNRVYWTTDRTLEHQDGEPVNRSETLENTDLLFDTASKGPIVTTPDGSAQYRIRVDNSGNLTTEQI